jgi:hypothetical protein
MRVRYADQVAAFLDRAEAAGVRHVTLLSTYNGDRAPREVDIAAVEADVAGREAFTYSILRPGRPRPPGDQLQRFRAAQRRRLDHPGGQVTKYTAGQII